MTNSKRYYEIHNINKKPVKINPQTFDDTACIYFIGSIIKCAIQDACKKDYYSHTGKRFLFYGKYLEGFLFSYGLLGAINCDYIRKQAQLIIDGKLKIEEINLKEQDNENEDGMPDE